MTTARVTGRDAIEFARTHRFPLRKHADPIDGVRAATVSEAYEIVAADPQIVYVDMPIPWARVEQTQSGAILHEGPFRSAREAIESMEKAVGSPSVARAGHEVHARIADPSFRIGPLTGNDS